MKKMILTVLIVIWMGFIFSMSCETGPKSSNTSGQTIEIALEMVPKFKKQPEEVKKSIIEEFQFVVRKSAHFIAYMILGILSSTLILQYENINRKFLVPWGICILYAMSDEFHQLFVPGRSGQVSDVLLDSMGSLLGTSIVLLIATIVKKLKKQNYSQKININKI